MTRNGMTPEQAVFGRSLRWFESAIEMMMKFFLQFLVQMAMRGWQLKSAPQREWL